MKRATCSRVVVDENNSSEPTGSPDEYFSTFTKYISNDLENQSETVEPDYQSPVSDDRAGDDAGSLPLGRGGLQLPDDTALLWGADRLGAAFLAVLCDAALSVGTRVPLDWIASSRDY